MTQSVIDLYEALRSAPDDTTRAKLIAEAFERLDERYPHLKDAATQGHVRESELRLQKEIEQVRKEIEQLRADLQLQIEQVRSELKTDIEQLRGQIATELEQLRGKIETSNEQLRGKIDIDIERLRGDIARFKIDLLKWLVPLMFAQIAAIAALVKLL
jgi:DNA repair exonuclease SbcCD ATPase subunit